MLRLFKKYKLKVGCRRKRGDRRDVFFLLCPSSRCHDRCSPCVRTYIVSMLRKQPLVIIEVLDAVLPFSIYSLVKVLPYLCALSFCFLVMSIDVQNDNREHLSSTSELRRTLAGSVTGASQHDVRVAQVHLDPAYRVA